MVSRHIKIKTMAVTPQGVAAMDFFVLGDDYIRHHIPKLDGILLNTLKYSDGML
jgi:hypothetical protein